MTHRSVGYAGERINIHTVAFPGYNGGIVFQVRHGKVAKSIVGGR